MSNRADQVWKSEALGKCYLEGVRGAIPFAQEQIDVMLHVVRRAVPQVGGILDLGCGDGVLGRALMEQHPEARVVFLDFSETMIEAAKAKVQGSRQAEFRVVDYGHPEWVEAVRRDGPFDVIVSGFSIHHQPDERKRSLYEELWNLLMPGGLFLNLEHVASATAWVEKVFDDYFIDALCRYHARLGTAKTREEIAQAYYDRPDKEANILAPVEEQCKWMREIGFEQVDCYFKIFELALFGGLRRGRGTPADVATQTPRTA